MAHTSTQAGSKRSGTGAVVASKALTTATR